ncbi:MAG: CoA transferase [Microbacterium sp.]
MTDGPLSGLLVADFSRVLAGPYCTMLLGDLGATVVKIEGPAGDETRAWMPPTHTGPHGDEATYYLSIDRNKRAVTLDLHDDADRSAAQRLAARADVVIENFKPGGIERFGLDYDTVRTANPRVVYASISGWGPGSELPGYDVLAQALSGLMSVTGSPDGEPSKAGVAIIDVVTGLHAALGILAALRHRDVTGEGQRVEVNLLSSALSALVNQSGAFAVAGVVPRRLGNDHPSVFPYGPFPTADGTVVIAVGNDGQFARLCHALDLAALPGDPRYATSRARAAHREELRPLLEGALAARSARDWYDVLTEAGVPCAPILDIGEAFAWADGLGLDPVISAGTDGDRMPGVRHPIMFSATPAAYPLAPPARDADREWLWELLGD